MGGSRAVLRAFLEAEEQRKLMMQAAIQPLTISVAEAARQAGIDIKAIYSPMAPVIANPEEMYGFESPIETPKITIPTSDHQVAPPSNPATPVSQQVPVISHSDPHQPYLKPIPKSTRESTGARRWEFFGPRLKAAGMSKVDWANASSVTYKTVRDYLRGCTRSRPSTMLKLGKTFGLTPDQMPE
jgi:hypothetical protein